MTDLLTADFAIRQLQGRYVDAVFRKDVAAFAACWADNAEWFIAGRHFVGRDAIAEGFVALAGYAERVLMMLGMPVLDIGTEIGTARGRWPVTELIKRTDGGHTRTVGIYDDRYAGSGLDWRFTERRWTLHYRGAGDFSDAFEVVGDPGPLA